MKAAVVTGVGGPEVIQVEDVPDPEMKSGSSLVRLSHAAINAADLWTRREGIVESFPHIPGSDGSGELVDTTDDRLRNLVGQRVVINPSLEHVTPEILAGGPLRDIVDILGYATPGTYAEYVSVPSSNVFAAPRHLSPSETAALPLTFLTAWRMLKRRAEVRPGERVLVWGASGGLGNAAIALLRFLNAQPIGVVGNASDEAALSSIDGVKVVRRDQSDLLAQILEAAGGQVDVVFDSVAGETWPQSLAALRPGGRIVLAGTTAGDVVTHDLSDFFYYQWTLLGSRMGNAEDFASMLHSVTVGRVRPVIDRVLPMSEASEGHRAMEESSLFGKIVLEIGA